MARTPRFLSVYVVTQTPYNQAENRSSLLESGSMQEAFIGCMPPVKYSAMVQLDRFCLFLQQIHQSWQDVLQTDTCNIHNKRNNKKKVTSLSFLSCWNPNLHICMAFLCRSFLHHDSACHPGRHSVLSSCGSFTIMRLGLGLSETDLRPAQKKSHSPSWPLGPRLDLVLPYGLARSPFARKIWGCLFSVPLDRLRQMCAIWLELLNRTLSNCLLSEDRDCAMTKGQQCLAMILCNDAKRTMKNSKVLKTWQRFLGFFSSWEHSNHFRITSGDFAQLSEWPHSKPTNTQQQRHLWTILYWHLQR